MLLKLLFLFFIFNIYFYTINARPEPEPASTFDEHGMFIFFFIVLFIYYLKFNYLKINRSNFSISSILFIRYIVNILNKFRLIMRFFFMMQIKYMRC